MRRYDGWEVSNWMIKLVLIVLCGFLSYGTFLSMGIRLVTHRALLCAILDSFFSLVFLVLH